jgi:hypothetical protein
MEAGGNDNRPRSRQRRGPTGCRTPSCSPLPLRPALAHRVRSGVTAAGGASARAFSPGGVGPTVTLMTNCLGDGARVGHPIALGLVGDRPKGLIAHLAQQRCAVQGDPAHLSVRVVDKGQGLAGGLG